METKLKNIFFKITSSLIYKPLSWFLCLSLLAYQTYHISDQYFKYQTVTSVTIDRPFKLNPPAIVLCFLRQDIIIPKHETEQLNFANLTAKEWFDYSASVHEIL